MMFKKKILVFMLAFAFAFSLTACGGEKSEYIEYSVTQTSESSTVSYDGKNLNGTVIDFAKAETPEKVYSVFGETETGKTDVDYLGRVQIIDGNVVVGLSVGDEPRMAGIYVKGFGYYFISADRVKNGEYAVCLKNVPYGTFQMFAFSIIEDDFIVSADGLSFTQDQALLLEGEAENEFTLEYGKLRLDGNKYQSLSDISFVVAKDAVLNVGEVNAIVQKDAGITLGVYGFATGDISKASYVYAGIKDGKATVIDYQFGQSTLLGEIAIENYDATAEYSLGVNLQEVASEPERKTQIVLSVNGNALLTIDKTVEMHRVVGFKCLSSSSAVSAVSIPPCTIEEYKAYAKFRFDSLVEVEFYEEHIQGLSTSYIEKKSKKYITEDETANGVAEYKFVQKAYDKAINAINQATDVSNATTLYNKHYELLETEVLDVYKDEIESSLKTMSENWYSIVNLEGDVTKYTKQDKTGDNIPDVSILLINGKYPEEEENEFNEMFFNLGIEGVDATTFDHRWWIPVPLRTPNILTSAHKEIAKCNSKEVLKIMYEEYYDAVLRSVCQKVIEEYHAIKHTEKDGFLWAYTWNYCGNEKGTLDTFVYDGPVTEYKGTEYGVSGETVFRLSPLIYKPGERGEGILGERGIVALFNYAMWHLSYPTVKDLP